MKSIGQKIKQLEGLLGTSDLTDWESGFVESVLERTKKGDDTTRLSEKQVNTVENIWRRFFA